MAVECAASKTINENLIGLNRKVALSPDQRLLTMSFFDPSSIALWDEIFVKDTQNKNASIFLDRDDFNDINQLVFSPNGRWVVATSNSAVRIWKSQNGQLVEKIGVISEGNLSGLAFSPDQKIMAVGGPDGKIYLFNSDTFQHLVTLSGHKGSVDLLAFSKDGRFLVSAGEDGALRVWEIP